jgi:hypothetical protein
MYETRGSNKCSSSLRSGRVEPTSGALRSACCIASSHYRCYNIRMCSRPAGGWGVRLGPRPRAARSAAQPAPARRPGAGVTLPASVRSGRGDRWGCSIFTYVLAYILYSVYITQWESGTIRVNQRSASVACGNKQWQGAALLQGASRGNLTSYAIRGHSVGIRHNPCQSVIGGKQWHAGAT